MGDLVNVCWEKPNVEPKWDKTQVKSQSWKNTEEEFHTQPWPDPLREEVLNGTKAMLSISKDQQQLQGLPMGYCPTNELWKAVWKKQYVN